MEEEENITYSPKRIIKPKSKKEESTPPSRKRSAAHRLFPEKEHSNLFRSSQDDEESEDEEGEQKSLEEAAQTLKNASAKQTSRLDGSTIVYDETWKKFRDRTGTQILEQDFDPEEARAFRGGLSDEQVNAAKDKDVRTFDRTRKITTDKMRQFVDRIIGKASMRREDVYNTNDERARTQIELPETLGLEEISLNVSACIRSAWTLVWLRCDRPPEKMEDIIFSDDEILIDLFAELAYMQLKICEYSNGLRPTLESKILVFRQHEFFTVRGINDQLNLQSRTDSISLPSYFPRTSSGYKRPRVTLA